jgi:DNA transformation protein and related proteins
MSLSEAFKDFVIEQMAGFGPVSVRRMFGGGGIYSDGLMFAVVDDDVLYLKVDDENRAPFDAENLTAITMLSKTGKVMSMSYHRAPERCMDDAEEMAQWCALGFGAALRAKKR